MCVGGGTEATAARIREPTAARIREPNAACISTLREPILYIRAPSFAICHSLPHSFPSSGVGGLGNEREVSKVSLGR